MKALRPLIWGLILLGLTAAPGQAAPFAYVPDFDGGTVSVIDTATNTVVARVAVGRGPWAAAVHPAGTFVYVTNAFSNTVSVLDTATNSVVANVPVAHPVTVAAHPAGTTVYVSDEGGTVFVIDTATHAVVATIATPWGMDDSPGIVVHPAGTFLYVANALHDSVSVIDTTTHRMVTDIPVGVRPWGVAVHPTGRFLYVTNSHTLGAASNNVSVIDTVSNTIIATVAMDDVPMAAAVHPDGTFVYVAGTGGSVSVVDTATNSVVARTAVGTAPAGVSVHPTGAFVYVPNSFDGTVSVLATASNAVVATIRVGGRPIDPGQFVGPTLPGVSITLNQATFHPGQTLTVRATTYGGAEPRLVDAYVEGRLPDGTIGFLQADGTFTADRRPIASNVPVGPSSGEVARHTFDGTHPAGSYRLQGYFTEPGTSSVIGLVAHAAFTVGP